MPHSVDIASIGAVWTHVQGNYHIFPGVISPFYVASHYKGYPSGVPGCKAAMPRVIRVKQLEITKTGRHWIHSWELCYETLKNFIIIPDYVVVIPTTILVGRIYVRKPSSSLDNCMLDSADMCFIMATFTDILVVKVMTRDNTRIWSYWSGFLKVQYPRILRPAN